MSIFRNTNSFEGYHSVTSREKNEQCHCNEEKITYEILENYHSILDRQQQLICSWKVFEYDGKITFTHGVHVRNTTDALVIRSSSICLINPWYRYITANQYLLSFVKQNQCYKICEVVLLECHCSTSSHEYELAIIQCPCRQQSETYCTYCRLILVATEQLTSDVVLPTQLAKYVDQQMNLTFALKRFTNEININHSYDNQSEASDHQHTTHQAAQSEDSLRTINEYDIKLSTNIPQQSLLSPQVVDENTDSSLLETKSIVLLNDDDNSSHHSIHSSMPQDTIDSDASVSSYRYSSGTTTNYQTRGTQTKLFAIFLPQSPLSEMTQANIEERTLLYVTRTCQVNTLSYLIKTNENQTNVQSPMKNLRLEKNIDYNQKHHTLPSRQHNEYKINIPTIEFDRDASIDDIQEERTDSIPTNDEYILDRDQQEEFISVSVPLKCINAFDVVDLNEPSCSVNSFCSGTDTRLSNSQDKKCYQPAKTTNQEHGQTQIQFLAKSFNSSGIHHIETSNNCQTSKLFRSETTPYRLLLRKRCRYRTKRRVSTFLRRLHYRRKSQSLQLLSSEQQSSSFFDTTNNQSEYGSSSIQRDTSSRRQQQPTPDLYLNHSNYYKGIDHTILARASKKSIASEQLQMLLNKHDYSVEQLIDLQLLLTCNDNYRSVCILIDDHKQSEQHRSLFLCYTYRTLSNSLKKILEKNSVEMTCMNLVFFNNSICDIINMQRLRVIDTGKKVHLLPSCEIALRTSDDIDRTISRLSTKMSFAHQIFIINFHHQKLSATKSFLFLHLAPICSIRPTGLLTNLNSTTYSVLNLIRQISHEHCFNHKTVKRYLFNDYLLNRLLKPYLFSSQQTMTVLTVKPKNIVFN